MRRFFGLLLDLLLIVAAAAAAVVLRDNLEVLPDHLYAIIPYVSFAAIIGLIALVTLRADRVMWRYSTLNDYLRLVLAVAVIVAGASVLGFIYNRLEGIPRALPLIHGILLTMLLVGVRVLRRIRHTSRGAAPVAKLLVNEMPAVRGAEKCVLIVGLTRLADLYIRSAVEFAPRTVRIAGLLGHKERYTGASVHQYNVLGMPEDVAEIVKTLEVHGVFLDSIVVAKRFETLSPAAQEALLELESSTSIRLEFLAESLGFVKGSQDSGPETAPAKAAGERSQVTFTYSPEEIASLYARPYWRIKRLADFAIAAILLVLAAPVMALVAIAVAIDVGIPVTFWQQRPGRGGRPIHLYKFRTMGSAHDSRGRRIPDSERVSAAGNFLRRTRLDELPQLFSILYGDMSFVGPRPLLPIDQSPGYAARLLVPPGLTGWAQVNGGRDVSAADKAALDVWYAQHASFLLDLRICLRTIPMIVFGERISRIDIQRAWRDLQDAGICPQDYARDTGIPAALSDRAA
jgi:lipopolysaccharide/colanic/teichoic acid biosynthesis glycosyltransferase